MIWWRIWSWWQKKKIVKAPNIYLNLGCGNKLLDGYLNLDVCLRAKGVVYHDIHELSFLYDNSVDTISAFDLLEHIGPAQVEDTMAEWIRVLKPGGVIVIQVPDLGTQATLYINREWDAEKFSKQILGAWDYGKPGDMEFALGHKVAYDRERLGALLVRHGCVVKNMAVVRTPSTFNLITIAEKQ